MGTGDVLAVALFWFAYSVPRYIPCVDPKSFLKIVMIERSWLAALVEPMVPIRSPNSSVTNIVTGHFAALANTPGPDAKSSPPMLSLMPAPSSASLMLASVLLAAP